jgi:glycerophosphoryl diester phosphodiesterase
MPATAPAWLTACAIAHRGLHDRGVAVVENTFSAADAAIVHGYAIECDVQIAADGEAVVFHDFVLDRLTEAKGRVEAMPSRMLAAAAFKTASDRIVTLTQFLSHVGGRVPVICEIKSRFEGDLRLAMRVAEVAAAYPGLVALKSFDPAIITHLQANRARLGLDRIPLGMVAQASYDDAGDWSHLPAPEKQALAQFLHFETTRPEFLSYRANDLPHAVPYLLRAGLGIPIITWTIRDPKQAESARHWADQIIFEGWRPA